MFNEEASSSIGRTQDGDDDDDDGEANYHTKLYPFAKGESSQMNSFEQNQFLKSWGDPSPNKNKCRSDNRLLYRLD